MEKYLPLQVTGQYNYEEMASSLNTFLKDMGVIKTDISGDEFLEFILSPDFADPLYSDETWKKKLNDIMLYNRSIRDSYRRLCMESGISPEESCSINPIDVALSFGASLAAPFALLAWTKNKQVYKPDPVFADALLKTADSGDITFSRNEVEHLPCSTFYLDLTDCDDLIGVAGVFVSISTSEKGMAILTSFVQDDEKEVYPHIIKQEYKDDTTMVTYDYSKIICPAKNVSTDAFVKALIFSLQMTTYLSSKEPDIEEDPVTKKTYKKPTIVHNKFSEVQEWDVGVRYASEVKKSLNIGSARHPASGRRSPIPHFRRAHWSHYWVGKGRKERVTRWIKPILVGAGNNAKDVVIHKTASP